MILLSVSKACAEGTQYGFGILTVRSGSKGFILMCVVACREGAVSLLLVEARSSSRSLVSRLCFAAWEMITFTVKAHTVPWLRLGVMCNVRQWRSPVLLETAGCYPCWSGVLTLPSDRAFGAGQFLDYKVLVVGWCMHFLPPSHVCA
jgi:hypothetical protein